MNKFHPMVNHKMDPMGSFMLGSKKKVTKKSPPDPWIAELHFCSLRNALVHFIVLEKLDLISNEASTQMEMVHWCPRTHVFVFPSWKNWCLFFWDGKWNYRMYNRLDNLIYFGLNMRWLYILVYMKIFADMFGRPGCLGFFPFSGQPFHDLKGWWRYRPEWRLEGYPKHLNGALLDRFGTHEVSWHITL